MNDSEDTSGSSITALIVFRENGDAGNLFVPVLCDAIRMTGVDVRCSTKEFWESDKTYDIIHFQWPEEVVGRMCDDPGIVRRLEERIAFFRSRGTHFVYTRHNVRPHYANEVIGRAYDIIESQSDVVVHMGRFSLEEFVGKHPDSRNAVILHHIYQYTYQEDISVERARQYLQLPQEAFIVTAFGEFRNCEEIRMVLGSFRSWNEKQKLLYVFDYMTERCFFIELTEIITGKDMNGAKCTKKAGEAPKQTVDFEEMAAAGGSLDLDENFYGDQDFDMEDFDQEGFDIGGGDAGNPYEEDKF